MHHSADAPITEGECRALLLCDDGGTVLLHIRLLEPKMASIAGLVAAAMAIPASPKFHPQPVDHFAASPSTTWLQRFYSNETSFRGPG